MMMSSKRDIGQDEMKYFEEFLSIMIKEKSKRDIFPEIKARINSLVKRKERESHAGVFKKEGGKKK